MAPKHLDKSEKMARMILQRYVESVAADVGNSIESILLVGSLATESYIPGPGDIDQITILQASTSEEIEKKVFEHINDAMAAFDRAVNLAPVVYRRSDLERPWRVDWNLEPETKHLITVPEELLRIHDHGKIAYGMAFQLSRLPKPTMEEIVAYHKRWRNWGQEIQSKHTERIPFNKAPIPTRIAVQIILSNAIWHYYYATGRTCFNKHRIAERLKNEVPNYKFQEGVELATRIRTSGFKEASSEISESLNIWCQRFQEWNTLQPVNVVPYL